MARIVVAPRVGAWIETVPPEREVRLALAGSPLAWGRGSKLSRNPPCPAYRRTDVAPRVGAWIETMAQKLSTDNVNLKSPLAWGRGSKHLCRAGHAAGPCPRRWCRTAWSRSSFRRLSRFCHVAAIAVGVTSSGSSKRATVSSVMYLLETAHSSFCSRRMAPTRRTMASSLGKIPTTLVLRLISLLTRSKGLVEWILVLCSLGKWNGRLPPPDTGSQEG